MKHGKAALALTLALSLLVGSAGAYTVKQPTKEELYTPELIERLDVSDWAQDELSAARTAGIITERTDGYFTKNITRLQFADLISNMLELALGKELTPAAEATFPDTTDAAVLKAAGAGVVKGLSGGNFGGDREITRQEICVMLDRAMLYLNEHGKPTPAVTGEKAPAAFTDWNQVAAWAQANVQSVLNRGVMNGSSATTVAPLSNTTIEQGILLVYRLYEKY